MNGFLTHSLAARNFRASAAISEFTLVIPRFRTDQFSLSAAMCLWKLLPQGGFSGCTLGSFKSIMNLYLLRA